MIEYIANDGIRVDVEDAGGKVIAVSHINRALLPDTHPDGSVRYAVKRARMDADRLSCGITVEVSERSARRIDADLCQPYGYVVYLRVDDDEIKVG